MQILSLEGMNFVWLCGVKLHVALLRENSVRAFECCQISTD